jgi:hypothetical protein
MSIAGGNDIVFGELAQTRYPINLRITIPFYPRAIFVTLIVGSEKRALGRLSSERERNPVNTWGNVIAVTLALSVASVAALFAALVASAL